MIKISKDNIAFWKYFFGGGILLMHCPIIAVVCIINFWVLYCAYLFIALIHFGFARVWRYLLIKDAYLDNHFQVIIFKDLNDKSEKFNCDQITKVKTYYGITDVYINDGGKVRKFYFMVNAKDNLKYLSGPAV